MKILLIGYGKMGKAVEKIALERSHEIVGIISGKDWANFESMAEKAELAIEFTNPEFAPQNIKRCLNSNLAVVSGSTGWLSHWQEVVNEVIALNGSFFYASNFSLGVNLFWDLAKKVASAMSFYTEYQVQIEEIHHLEKKDKPSGTAITLAEYILPFLSQFEGWKLDPQANESSFLPIHSFRQKDVSGIHHLIFRNSTEEISLSHTAHNREGFAHGAVLAAEWLRGKKGIFGMQDMLMIPKSAQI
jgi:4-hydroxy-tetrahydrodipicolinate reductase